MLLKIWFFINLFKNKLFFKWTFKTNSVYIPYQITQLFNKLQTKAFAWHLGLGKHKHIFYTLGTTTTIIKYVLMYLSMHICSYEQHAIIPHERYTKTTIRKGTSTPLLMKEQWILGFYGGIYPSSNMCVCMKRQNK